MEIRKAPIFLHAAGRKMFVLRWPLDKIEVTSNFGQRSDPITGLPDFHDAIDLGGERGDLVVAPERGIVIWAGPKGACGNLVAIDHGFGISTRYGHMSKFGRASCRERV